MGSDLRLFPSGFFGSTCLTSATRKSNAPHHFSFNVQADGVQNQSSMEVDLLWSDMLLDLGQSKTFEFKERVVRIALVAFGSGTMKTWFDAQLTSPFFDEYRSKWIEETLYFVKEGKRRQYSFNVWLGLFGAPIRNNCIALPSIADKYYGRYGACQIEDTEKFIQQWVSKPNGVDDLLGSLKVLFGQYK